MCGRAEPLLAWVSQPGSGLCHRGEGGVLCPWTQMQEFHYRIPAWRAGALLTTSADVNSGSVTLTGIFT